jgi:uncharacterized protein (TIGR04255 family)
MGTKMRNAPVFFTIAQARFNPILTLDSYAPQIQEKLRRRGYPDAKKGFLATINLNLNPVAPTEAGAQQIPVAQSARYMFCNMAQTAGFILDQGALSFQTTAYDVFETFSADFLTGLEAVEDAVQLSYIDRIGVRYLDAVFPRTGEALRDYLCSSVLGLTEKLPGTVVHSFSETLVTTDSINVLSRVIIQDSAVGFPPDLQPMTLKLAERFRELRGRHAIIDTDGSFESREEVNLKRVGERLNFIHEEISRAFRVSVTEHALKAWE